MPKPEVVPKQSVFYLPQNMRGIEELKTLFCTELNYRADISLPYKSRGRHASAALAQDPMFFTVVGCPDLLHSWVMQHRPDSAYAYNPTIRPRALNRTLFAAGDETERSA